MSARATAVVAGRRDAILLPNAEGGPAVTISTPAREAIHGLAEGSITVYADFRALA